jgi:hypothetical protein
VLIVTERRLRLTGRGEALCKLLQHRSVGSLNLRPSHLRPGRVGPLREEHPPVGRLGLLEAPSFASSSLSASAPLARARK